MSIMALQVPNLDDKTFQELAAEAVALIPRYSRDWTDHNLHDPGITFLELFAWLAEMQIYQLNRITDNQIDRFLKMVGMARLARQPAQVEIEFTVAAISTLGLLPAGTRVVPLGHEHLIFETEDDFFTTRTRLIAVNSHWNSTSIDHTEANNKEGIYFFPFGEQAAVGAILELGFDQPFADAEMANLFFLLRENDLPAPAPRPEGADEIQPSATLVWEYSVNGTWAQLNALRDTTLSLNRSGRLVFIPPADWTAQNGVYWLRGRLAAGLYEIPPVLEHVRLNVIPARQVETVVHEDLGEGTGLPHQRVRLQKLPLLLAADRERGPLRVGDILNWPEFLTAVRQAGTTGQPATQRRFWDFLPGTLQALIKDELISRLPTDREKYQIVAAFNQILTSTDLYDPAIFAEIQPSEAYQQAAAQPECDFAAAAIIQFNRRLFDLAFANQVARLGLVIQVQDHMVWEDWQRVEDFESSAASDRHYVLEVETGEITFGNGQNGRIPGEGRSMRAYFYQTSHGSEGNVSAGLTWRLEITGAAGARGTNVLPASGGREPETIAEAQLRAQEEMTSRQRAVTSSDFEQLALATPGLRVARAKALPNYHPEFPSLNMPGNVTVVAVPALRSNRVTPAAGAGFLHTVQRHLEARRLVATAVHVIAPAYVQISVRGKIFKQKKSDATAVQARALAALQKFLHPLTGGPNEDGWTFGRPVYAAEIYQLLDDVEGVDHVVGIELEAVALQQLAQKVITIPPNALVYSGEHQLEVI
ncbi:putative baseplate assembly protein [candidate division KSB1 bacterium]|nr:MAG: putative baseplate assembly protein [candidate division KSB1 bacterium]